MSEKSLLEKKIIITRSKKQAGTFAGKLKVLGAEPFLIPTIEIISPENTESIDQAISQLEAYDWIIFTSTNAVRYFFNRISGLRKEINELPKMEIKLASIGFKTTNVIEELGLQVSFQPTEYVAEKFIEEFAQKELAGTRILIPRALQARDIIPDGLKQAGAKVDIAVVYQTIPSKKYADELVRILREEQIDVATFTSGSTFFGFHEIIKNQDVDLTGLLIASIGPVTSRKIRELDYPVDIEAREYTVDGLIEAIIKFYETGNGKEKGENRDN